MPNVEYECVVNKTHPKKTFSAVQKPPPMCCGKFMARIDKPARQAAARPSTTTAQPEEPVAVTIARKPWWKGLFGKTDWSSPVSARLTPRRHEMPSDAMTFRREEEIRL